MSGPHNPATKIEKQILENAFSSNWLRSCFQLAIRRDPVDALNDAELLASALRARTLEALSKDATLNPQITSMLLRQHAHALSQLAKSCDVAASPAVNIWTKHDIASLVIQMHQISRKLRSAGEPIIPVLPMGELTTSESVAGQLL